MNEPSPTGPTPPTSDEPVDDKAAAAFAQRLSMLAHDAKNPLSAALTNLAFVTEVSATEGEAAEAVRDSIVALNRVRALLDDAATTARLEANAAIQRSSVVLAAIAASAVEANAAEAVARRCALSSDTQPEARVRGDMAMLSRSVDLMVESALRCSRAGGRIHVRASVEGSDARLSVCLEARPTDQPRLRALAERPLDATPTDIGLGLHYARVVARAHGGSLSVTAEPPWASVITLHVPA